MRRREEYYRIRIYENAMGWNNAKYYLCIFVLNLFHLPQIQAFPLVETRIELKSEAFKYLLRSVTLKYFPICSIRCKWCLQNRHEVIVYTQTLEIFHVKYYDVIHKCLCFEVSVFTYLEVLCIAFSPEHNFPHVYECRKKVWERILLFIEW